jgi:hypothetical protein
MITTPDRGKGAMKSHLYSQTVESLLSLSHTLTINCRNAVLSDVGLYSLGSTKTKRNNSPAWLTGREGEVAASALPSKLIIVIQE